MTCKIKSCLMVFWRLWEPFLDPIELRETEDTCIYICSFGHPSDYIKICTGWSVIEQNLLWEFIFSVYYSPNGSRHSPRKLPRRFRKTVAMTVEILVGLPRSKCYVTDKNVGDNCYYTYSLCDWGLG